MYKVFEPKKEVIFINTEKQLGNSSKGNRSKNTNEKEVIEYVFSKDPYDELMKYYADHKLLKAAGGLVQNDSYFLWIYRNNIWDLPKGKVEKNENVSQTALREVVEETGIENISLIRPIEKTFHIFKRGKKHYLKCTHWFEMKSNFHKYRQMVLKRLHVP